MTAIALPFVLAFAGFASLAVSQDQHRRAMALVPATRGARRLARIVGTILVLAALPPALWSEGAGLGSLLWLTAVSIAAGCVTALLSWRPRTLHAVARLVR